MNYFWVFFSAFIKIGLAAFQTLQFVNMQEMQYASLRILLVGAVMGFVWIFNVNSAVKNCKLTKVAYILGTSTGGVFGANLSMYFS